MRSRFLAAPLLGATMLLAACGGAAAPTAAPATAAPATQAPATAAPASADSGAAVALADTSLGKVLVDGKGLTLYVFTPDNAGDSTCYDKCEAAWPPLLGAGATAGDGLTAGDLGTAARKDGKTQVTFKGWPLYYFAADKAAGDVAGQGVGGKWWVVDATGKMIGADAASPAASQAAAGGPAVNVASTSLGDVLVDAKGMTLYMFTADSAGTSACSGDCLANWPVLAGEGATPGTGLNAADFASITRDDGSKQVTFHGMPLYFFAGDKAAGDVAGQGIGGKWYVLKADGTVVK
jgi:predicted lipoprotein with Yx(FWY)xxD motif